MALKEDNLHDTLVVSHTKVVLQNDAKSLRDNWHLDRKGKGVVLERTRIYVLKLS